MSVACDDGFLLLDQHDMAGSTLFNYHPAPTFDELSLRGQLPRQLPYCDDDEKKEEQWQPKRKLKSRPVNHIRDDLLQLQCPQCIQKERAEKC